MKKLPTLKIAFMCLSLAFFASSYKEKNEDPFDEEAEQAYEAVIAVQDSSDIVLAAFETSMDSAAAVEALAQWFRDHENVEWAKVSSQGISVSYTNGIYGAIMIDPEYYDSDPQIASIPNLGWTDSTFHAESFTPSGNGGTTMTIEGEMSSDGKTILHCLLTISKIHSDGQFDQESKLEIANMLIWQHDEWNCWDSFMWYFEGAASQTYIQSIEYKKYDYQEQEWVTIQGIDWGNSLLYGSFANE